MGEGDVGLLPGRWDDAGGYENGAGGYQNGGGGYQDGVGGPGNGYDANGGVVGGDEDDEANVHYGPVPARVLRRNRTQKRVQ